MWRKKLIFLAAGVLCLVALSATLAGIRAAPDTPAADFTIPWWTVDSGGGVSQGGPYNLIGTIGQPEPGNLSGGIYLLKGGFWSGLLDYRIYLPLLSR
jgi:hypothetical protein